VAVPPDLASLEASIRRFLTEVLGIAMSGVGRDASLVRSGLVDSVGMVRLAAFLEAELDLTIPDRDVTADHFDSLAAIDAYARRRIETDP
jgi:acyl carrier protein